MAVKRGMRGATAASLTVHALVGAWLVTRPVAPRPRPPEITVTEMVFVELEPADALPAPEVETASSDGDADAQRRGDPMVEVARDPRPGAAPSRRRPSVRRRPVEPAAQPAVVASRPETSAATDSAEASVAADATEAPAEAVEDEPGLAMRRFSPRAALGAVKVSGPVGAASDQAARAAPGRDRPGWMPPASDPVGGNARGAGSGSSLGEPTAGGTFTHDKPGYKAVTGSDGRVVLKDKPNVGIDIVGLGAGIGITGHFDVTDWVERLAGNDPYAYEKLKYLDATRDERARMIRKYENEVRRKAAMELRAQLRQLWNAREHSPAERRQALFELWDECDVAAEGPRGRAAAFARVTIEGFIRRRLPAGSDNAFTRDELRRLNQRRESTAPFAPYASPPNSR